MKAAVARVDISTSVLKIHDPLCAKMLLLNDGAKNVLMISLDTICLGGGGIGEFSDGFFNTLKSSVMAKGAEAILCGTTHTHTLMPMIAEEEVVLKRILDKYDDLVNALEPVTVGLCKTHDDSFVINRTLVLKDGSEWTVRQAHPVPPEESYDRLAEVDDTVNVIRFDRADKTPLCVMFNFGCHPLVGYANSMPTGNYPGIAESFVEENIGTTAIMFQSTGGDATEVDYKDYFHPKECERWGLNLGQTVARAARKIETKDVDLDSWCVDIDLPLRTDIPENMEKIKKEILDIALTTQNSPLDFKKFLPLYTTYTLSPDYPLDYKYRYLHEEAIGSDQYKSQDIINRTNIDKYLSNLACMEKISKLAGCYEVLEWHLNRINSLGTNVYSTEVTGIRIGNIYIVSAPVEPIVEVGKILYKTYEDKNIFFASYSNGYIHYGATEERYQNGGYETCECDLDKSWFKIYMAAVDEVMKKIEK